VVASSVFFKILSPGGFHGADMIGYRIQKRLEMDNPYYAWLESSKRGCAIFVFNVITCLTLNNTKREKEYLIPPQIQRTEL
jgi:hypothetical protein